MFGLVGVVQIIVQCVYVYLGLICFQWVDFFYWWGEGYGYFGIVQLGVVVVQGVWVGVEVFIGVELGGVDEN